MNEIGTSIGSIGWWLSVVVVGVLINIAAAYLKSGVDSLLSRFSSYWRDRTEKAREEYLNEIEGLKKSKELQRQYEHREIRTRLEAILGIVFAVMLLAYKAVAKMYPELSTAQLVGLSDAVSGTVFASFIAVLVLGSFKLYIRAESLEDKLAMVQGKPGARRK